MRRLVALIVLGSAIALGSSLASTDGASTASQALLAASSRLVVPGVSSDTAPALELCDPANPNTGIVFQDVHAA